MITANTVNPSTTANTVIATESLLPPLLLVCLWLLLVTKPGTVRTIEQEQN